MNSPTIISEPGFVTIILKTHPLKILTFSSAS